MANNLKDHLKEVADAIRAKKGTNDLINPQDFATEIEGITSGSGGGESGGSNIEYLDVSGGDFAEHPESKPNLILASSTIRIKGEGYLNIIPSAYLMIYQDELSIANVKALKIDMNEMFLQTNTEPKTIKEELEKSYGKEYLASIPRITKEQFYDLNA